MRIVEAMHEHDWLEDSFVPAAFVAEFDVVRPESGGEEAGQVVAVKRPEPDHSVDAPVGGRPDALLVEKPESAHTGGVQAWTHQEYGVGALVEFGEHRVWRHRGPC